MGLLSGLFKSLGTFGLYDPCKDGRAKPEDYRDAPMHLKIKEAKGDKVLKEEKK